MNKKRVNAKLLFLNECRNVAEMWFLSFEGNFQENVGVSNEGDPNIKVVGVSQIGGPQQQ